MVLYVPDNNSSGLYDFDKYELGHKFHRILNGHMSTLCHIITGYILFVLQKVLAIYSWILHPAAIWQKLKFGIFFKIPSA